MFGGPRYGFDESPGIGMCWTIENVVDWAALDELSAIQDVHTVGGLAGDREVVGDEHIGESELLPQAREQVEDLRLDGDVERGDRLVADDHLRLDRERARDRDALTLTAGQGCGLPRVEFGREADLI